MRAAEPSLFNVQTDSYESVECAVSLLLLFIDGSSPSVTDSPFTDVYTARVVIRSLLTVSAAHILINCGAIISVFQNQLMLNLKQELPLQILHFVALPAQ